MNQSWIFFFFFFVMALSSELKDRNLLALKPTRLTDANVPATTEKQMSSDGEGKALCQQPPWNSTAAWVTACECQAAAFIFLRWSAAGTRMPLLAGRHGCSEGWRTWEECIQKDDFKAVNSRPDSRSGWSCLSTGVAWSQAERQALGPELHGPMRRRLEWLFSYRSVVRSWLSVFLSYTRTRGATLLLHWTTERFHWLTTDQRFGRNNSEPRSQNCGKHQEEVHFLTSLNVSPPYRKMQDFLYLQFIYFFLLHPPSCLQQRTDPRAAL